MEVREARAQDIERMLDGFEAVAAEGRWIGAEAPIDRDCLTRRWRERMNRSDEALLVAAAGDTVVGSAGVRGRGPSELGMWVLQEWRRKGVGTALVAAGIEWARSAGSHKLTLQVWPHNEPAIKLYEKFGFEHEGYLRKQWRRRDGELWDAVTMGLVLDDSIRPPESDTPTCGGEG